MIVLAARLKRIVQPFIYKTIKWHYRKTRMLTKRGIVIKLYPSVFHPTYYLSTDIFLDLVLDQNITNKSVLELGCGNGFITLYLAKNKNTKAYASDINAQAIIGLKENALENNVKVSTFVSDLFDSIPKLDFDYILINPPYFEKSITSNDEYAFFTGENFAYFEKFFVQIKKYNLDQTIVYLIFSETVDLNKIFQIASKNEFDLLEVHQKEKNGESFLIYQLKAAR